MQPTKGVTVDSDRIEGNLKQGEGKLTGDEDLHRPDTDHGEL